MDILKRDGVYFGDGSLAREKRDYSEDSDKMEGDYPIWGFIPKEDELEFTVESLMNGNDLFRFGNEMSFHSNEINHLIIIELDVPSGLHFMGTTHNAYLRAHVFPRIEMKWVRSFATIEYPTKESAGSEYKDTWYYPTIKPIDVYSHRSIFRKGFTCGERKLSSNVFG